MVFGSITDGTQGCTKVSTTRPIPGLPGDTNK